MPYALTNNKISITYGRLVQRVSGSYYDGLGNLITFGGGLSTGSTYPFTSSWANNAVSASYALTASYALNGFSLTTGSTYPITSSWAIHSINVDGGYVTASGIVTSGDIIPSNPSASLGTVEFPFKSISISSGSLIIANENPLIPAAILSNNFGNLDVSSGGIRLIQPNSSFIAPTASFSYLSSSFKQVGDRTLIGNDTITGSLQVTNGITGSLYGTSSWTNNSVSSSHSEYSYDADKLDGQHGSYYQKALVTGSTYPITASWANRVLSASYSSNASASMYTQNVIVYAKNGHGAIIPKGKVVRIIGADNSANSPTIGLADWTNDANSANTLGLTMQSFGINGFGYVLTEGKLSNVNTQGFLPGDLLYLSSSGTYTNVSPPAPKHSVRLGEVIRSQLNNGSIYVRIDNGVKLGELHDVVDTTTTTSYGDLLVKSGSVWKNTRNLTGSYYLEGTFVLTHVSQSLNFANDAAAGIGGVPRGGLYRSGSFVKIRMI